MSNMKTMQVFDCQDMPSYHKNGWEYKDERNLCSKFLRLNTNTPNDSYVEWPFHSMSEEELEEYFYDGWVDVWDWKQSPRDAAKDVNKWLRDNGATDATVLIKHWW